MFEKYYGLILFINIFFISNIFTMNISYKNFERFFFIGIVIHEISHILINSITGGKTEDLQFSVCEKTNTSARASLISNKTFITLVAVAPMFLLPLLIVFIIYISNINVDTLNIFTSIKDFLIVLLVYILLISSRLSSLDIQLYFEYFFSLVNIASIVGLSYYIYNNQDILNEIIIFINQYENLFLNINILLIILIPISFLLKK